MNSKTTGCTFKVTQCYYTVLSKVSDESHHQVELKGARKDDVGVRGLIWNLAVMISSDMFVMYDINNMKFITNEPGCVPVLFT